MQAFPGERRLTTRQAMIVLVATVVILSVACQPAATFTPPASPTPAPTATPTPRLPTPTPDPEAALEEARLLMLELINEVRADAGVPPVELGYNRAAQVHAENLAEACAVGHWGLDGTKPAWRYSLAGGYQVNAENVSGLAWCVKTAVQFRDQVQKDIEGFMASAGHRAVILDLFYRRVNLGFAANGKGFLTAVQQFEGDYVDYKILPRIQDGVLQVQGRLQNGANVSVPQDLQVQVWYDQAPRPVTVGQVSRTSCVDPGRQVAELEPLPPGRTEIRWKPMQADHKFCLTPHDFPADTPPPASSGEALKIVEASTVRMATRDEVILPVQWLPATTWQTGGEAFAVVADLGAVLEEHGAGVYNIVVWAPVNGETVVVSEYAIFHKTEPPEGYGQ